MQLHSCCTVLTFIGSAVAASILLVTWQHRSPLTWSSDGSAFLIGRAAADASLWEVVFEGEVNVRNGKSMESLVLGQKEHGEQVLARQEGDWLKLADEEGFMMIKADVRLMRKVTQVEEDGGEEVTGAKEAVNKEAADSKEADKSVAKLDGHHPKDVCVFEAHHPSWSGNVSFYKDGRLQTVGVDTLSGKWKAEGPKLVINWDNYGIESLETSDGGRKFGTSYGFTMRELQAEGWWYKLFEEKKKTERHPANEIQCKRMDSAPDIRSLFCFIVAAKKNGAEVALVQTQLETGIGIVHCEDAAIVTDANLVLGDDCGARVLTISPIHDQRRSTNNTSATRRSWLNVESFSAVFDIIRQDGGFRLHRWTVKVDADAVFMPERLRRHIAALEDKHQDLDMVYIRNSNKHRDIHVHGSLEVLSQAATERLAEGQDLCLKKFAWQSWEEGYFLERCLEELGVRGVEDYDSVGSSCSDATKVAYHPFKEVDTFATCWKQARESEIAPSIVTSTERPTTSRTITSTTELTARPSTAAAAVISTTTTTTMQSTSRTWAPAVG